MAELVVYFNKPAYWADTVHIHYWDTRPGSQASAWPGVPMTAEADGWFVHRFDGIEAASLVFNDNQRCQTGGHPGSHFSLLICHVAFLGLLTRQRAAF